VILEGLATTRNADRSINVAPMGPIVDDGLTRLVLRPFPTSRTYANLRRERCGVFHVVDDVLLLAQAAIDQIDSPPETGPAEAIDGEVLRDCCRWHEFQIESIDESGPRPVFAAQVVHQGRRRDFWGFNRAKHAVIEAAVAASRVHLLPTVELAAEFDRWRTIVQKTGGDREAKAFELLEDYVRSAGSRPVTSTGPP
jgi:hypothetical protein